jgi:hypothetical protein
VAEAGVKAVAVGDLLQYYSRVGIICPDVEDSMRCNTRNWLATDVAVVVDAVHKPALCNLEAFI